MDDARPQAGPHDAQPPATPEGGSASARPDPDKHAAASKLTAAIKLTGKVTSKLQVTIPKALATQLGIKPGDRLQWEMLGRALQMVPIRAGRSLREQERSARWAQMVERGLARRDDARDAAQQAPGGRGWTRAELYERQRREPR